MTTTTVAVKVKTSSWQSDLVVQTPGGTISSGSLISAISRFWDASGNPGVCIAYAYRDGAGVEGYRFAYRLDSDAHNAAWTIETIVSSPTRGVDGHLDIQSAVLSGDTAATVWMANKGVLDGIFFYRRSPSGSWSAQSALYASWTRPRVCIDTTNSNVYLSGHAVGDVRLQYHYLDARTNPVTSSPPSALTLIEDNGTNTTGNDHDSPCHPVNSSSGYMVGTIFSTTGHWWNKLTIAGTITGSASQTEVADTVTQTGSLLLNASASQLEITDTQTTTATTTITGSVSQTELDDTVSQTSSISLNASANQTELSDISTESATILISAVVDQTELDDLVNETGTVGNTNYASANQLELDDTSTNTGSLSLNLSGSQLELPDTQTVTASITIQASALQTELSDISIATGTQDETNIPRLTITSFTESTKATLSITRTSAVLVITNTKQI